MPIHLETPETPDVLDEWMKEGTFSSHCLQYALLEFVNFGLTSFLGMIYKLQVQHFI